MSTKFQVGWTSNSSKTTSTKKPQPEAEQTDERADKRRHRPENIMPINVLYFWG